MASYLEQRFPHVVSRLTSLWSDPPQAAGYLDGLLFKERERVERRGFDLDAWRELVFLDRLLSIEKPADEWQDT